MILFIFLIILLILIFIFTSKPRGYPPGPIRLPLVGYALHTHPTRPYYTWNYLRRKYGDVLGLYFGHQRTVIVNGWEAVKEGLANDDLNDRPQNIIFKDIYGNAEEGVMFVNGEKWKVHRRFILFHLRNLGFGKKSHESVIQEELTELIQEFKEKNRQPFCIQTILGSSAVNILWAVIGGQKFSRKDEKLNELVNLIIKAFRTGQVTGVLDTLSPFRKLLPNLSGYNDVTTSIWGVLDFIQKSVTEHRGSLDPNNPRDFIDIFLNEVLKQKDETFTDLQLGAICQDLFSAGIETSSSNISFNILYLCLYPEKQKKIQEEVDRVVGRDRLPNLNDKTKLVYLEAFMNEIMRIRCPAPHTVPHWSRADTQLQGHRIPKDTLVIFNLRSVLMEEDYWGDPEVFRPERFLNEDGSLKKSERMIPFGRGKRVCLGESLARMNSFLAVASFVQNFTFAFPPGGYVKDTEGVIGFTLGPPPFKVIATPR